MKRKIVAIFVGLFIISGVLIGIIFASAQADEKHAATEEMGILILPTEGVRIHALQVDIDSFKYAETEEEKEKVLQELLNNPNNKIGNDAHRRAEQRRINGGSGRGRVREQKEFVLTRKHDDLCELRAQNKRRRAT